MRGLGAALPIRHVRYIQLTFRASEFSATLDRTRTLSTARAIAVATIVRRRRRVRRFAVLYINWPADQPQISSRIRILYCRVCLVCLCACECTLHMVAPFVKLMCKLSSVAAAALNTHTHTHSRVYIWYAKRSPQNMCAQDETANVRGRITIHCSVGRSVGRTDTILYARYKLSCTLYTLRLAIFLFLAVGLVVRPRRHRSSSQV